MSTKEEIITLHAAMSRDLSWFSRDMLRTARAVIAEHKRLLRVANWPELSQVFRRVRWWPDTPVCRELSACNQRLDEINSRL